VHPIGVGGKPFEQFPAVARVDDEPRLDPARAEEAEVVQRQDRLPAVRRAGMLGDDEDAEGVGVA
jgi:hypothetical protein